jgi:hypothetical protein
MSKRNETRYTDALADMRDGADDEQIRRGGDSRCSAALGQQGGIMTQEYTPTDNGIAHYAARGMDTMGICEYDEAKRRWSRWLAAHDAEVRDKALTLTDEEIDVAAEANEDAEDESWYYNDKRQAIMDVLKAVASFRKELES